MYLPLAVTVLLRVSEEGCGLGGLILLEENCSVQEFGFLSDFRVFVAAQFSEETACRPGVSRGRKEVGPGQESLCSLSRVFGVMQAREEPCSEGELRS